MVQINVQTQVYDKLLRNLHGVRHFSTLYPDNKQPVTEDREELNLYKQRLRQFKSAMSKVYGILCNLESEEPALARLVVVTMARGWGASIDCTENKTGWEYKYSRYTGYSTWSKMFHKEVDEDTLEAVASFDDLVSVVGEEERLKRFILFKLMHL